MRRALLVAAALGAFAIATFAALVASDVLRWESAFSSGDALYRADPERAHLWAPPDVAPFRVGEAILDVRDDLEIRWALQAVRLSDLEGSSVTDPRLAIQRGEAHGRLSAILEEDGDASRRSSAANLLGIMSIVATTGGTSPEQVDILKAAVSYFATAIDLDPSNDDAKHNLELAYQRARDARITEAIGSKPAPGGKGSRGAGAARPGSGY